MDIIEHLAAAPAIAADNVAMTAASQIIEILARHHATVANKHDALEPEALLQINHDVGDRHGIAPIAGEYMMRDRPTVDHDQTHEHLRVARLAVAAVAVGADLRRSLALEIG